MGAGGKGGSQTVENKVTIPDWAENAAISNLDRADMISRLGYVPYYGPDVAAMSPMQNAAKANVQSGASAFGLQGGGGSYLPEPKQFAGGMSGYSSGDGFDQSLEALKQKRPGQYDYIMDMFINPFTGKDSSKLGDSPLTWDRGPLDIPAPGSNERIQDILGFLQGQGSEGAPGLGVAQMYNDRWLMEQLMGPSDGRPKPNFNWPVK